MKTDYSTACRTVSIMHHSIAHKPGPNCLALVLLVFSVSLGLFNEYLVEVRRLKYVESPMWGNRNDTGIRQYRINISDQVLDETFLKLQYSTSSIRNRDQYQNDTYLKVLDEIVDYWTNIYNWRDREAYLNKYPNYKTTIQGLDIHYVHVVPNTTRESIPILMLHGWPGSFKDFYELVPLLTNESHELVFELVLPSLVGHLFSEGPQNGGIGGPQQATIFYNLMRKLGYEQFYVYGNDWGSVIATDMATLYPENVMGLYMPLCLSLRRVSIVKYIFESMIPDYIVDKAHKTKYSILKLVDLLWNEAAFMHYHFTKPESIGFYLSESPVVLAHYILNIINTATYLQPNSLAGQKNLTEIYGHENLIDIVMLYWITETKTSAVRSFKDIINNYSSLYQIPIKAVPVACPKFLDGIFYQSDWILKDKFDYILERKTFSAKHFYLFENNSSFLKLHAADLRSSIRQMLNVKKFSIDS